MLNIAITNVDYIPVILYYIIFVPIASYIEHLGV